MRIYLLPQEKLLLEADGWAIIGSTGTIDRTYASHSACTVEFSGDIKHPIDRSIKTHRTNDMVYGEFCWFPDSSLPRAECEICEAPVPEGIQALVLLHGDGEDV